MALSRRDFLVAATTTTLLPTHLRAQPFMLTAEPVTAQILPEGDNATAMLGFNGSTPGPVLRFKQGARLDLRFQNSSGAGSAVHWHGIRIVNAMDGVPGLTQGVVENGESFDYAFNLPDAGTYWYHSHHRSWEQVARGLYGPLIVDEADPPAVDHDVIAMIDDWRLERDGRQIGDYDNRHDQAHNGRLGNYARALFVGAPSALKRNERLRLRLINTATDRVFPLRLAGLDGRIVALDGMPHAAPPPLGEITLAPAQRIDIIADVSGDEIAIDFVTRDGPYRLGEMAVDGEAPGQRFGDISPLTANRTPVPDLDNAVRVPLRMEGGAMSNRMMMGGMMNGDVWAFNGHSGLADAPVQAFDRGKTAVIELVNDTRFAHAIHLHGHHFQEARADGLGPLRDTILVDAGEQRNIACVMDNPGKWLLHCHMLGHQAAGMRTWVEVA